MKKTINKTCPIEIPDECWKQIENQYESGEYQGVIQNVCIQLTQCIRERTGLETDGDRLVTESFGGPDPILKINPLFTRTEKSEQEGLALILKGVYKMIRNPFSHNTVTINQADCTAILAFISYLIRRIEGIKSKFDTQAFIDHRIADPMFTDTSEYATLLVEEIPEKMQLDFLMALSQSDKVRPTRFKLMVDALSPRLKEKDEYGRFLSELLKTTHDDHIFTLMASLRGSEQWSKLEEVSRMRAETAWRSRIIVLDIDEYPGDYWAYQDFLSRLHSYQEIATWVDFSNGSDEWVRELKTFLCDKFCSGRFDELLFEHFKKEMATLLLTDDQPDQVTEVIVRALRSGNSRHYNWMKEVEQEIQDRPWFKKIEPEMRDFQPIKSEPSVYDEIPF